MCCRTIIENNPPKQAKWKVKYYVDIFGQGQIWHCGFASTKVTIDISESVSVKMKSQKWVTTRYEKRRSNIRSGESDFYIQCAARNSENLAISD